MLDEPDGYQTRCARCAGTIRIERPTHELSYHESLGDCVRSIAKRLRALEHINYLEDRNAR